MTIRSNLLLLGLGAMVPVLAFAVLISVLLIDQDRREFERGAIARARAMMSAVDAQLLGETNTIEAVAPSRALAAGDLALFHEQALRVLRTQPTWLDIVLALPSGEVVVDANVPQGATLPPREDSSVVREAVRLRQPVVGPVSRQSAAGPMTVPIGLPIVRDGTVAYVLTVLVRPESFEPLIRAQDLPPGSVSGIVDGNGNFVARVPPRPVGTPSSQAFQDEVRRSKEGWYRGLTVEGLDTFSAHARSERNNWSIGLGIPADIVLAGTRRTALLIGMGALAAIALAFGLAVVIGRRIERPMVSLAALARSIGKEGAAMPIPHANVREVDDVALALKDADSAVRERHVLVQRFSTMQ